MGKMFVVTHKAINNKIRSDYDFFYVNSLVNDFSKEKFNDAIGVNISDKNKYFCELTALYSIWKNKIGFNDNVGFCHYRRFFYSSNFLKGNCVSIKKLDRLLKKYDIIKPYCSEVLENNIYEFYKKNHLIEDLDLTLKVIKDKSPDYYPTCESYFFNNRKASFLNMFYARFDIIADYCEWLFPILFEVEKGVSFLNRDPYQQRVFGFLAEHLFNVWILKNNLHVGYLNLRFTENSALKDTIFAIRNRIFRRKHIF